MTPAQWFDKCFLKQKAADEAKGQSPLYAYRSRGKVLDRVMKTVPKTKDPDKKRFLQDAAEYASGGFISFGRKVVKK